MASYTAAVSDKSEFDVSLNSRGYSPEALAEAKKILEKQFTPVTTLGLRFTRPLENFKSDILAYAWLLFDNYERGNLPFPGSVSEQPAQIMEIFGTLESLRLERKRIETKRLESQAKRARQTRR